MLDFFKASVLLLLLSTAIAASSTAISFFSFISFISVLSFSALPLRPASLLLWLVLTPLLKLLVFATSILFSVKTAFSLSIQSTALARPLSLAFKLAISSAGSVLLEGSTTLLLVLLLKVVLALRPFCFCMGLPLSFFCCFHAISCSLRRTLSMTVVGSE